MGQLVDIMLGKVAIPKYSDPGSPIAGILINGTQIKKALIDMGATINVMTKDIMQQINITSLRPTPTILQLADSSTV